MMPGNILLDLAVKINIMLAIGTLLPIPPVAGHNILYASRWLYFVALGIAITLAVLFVIPGLSFYFMLTGVFLGVAVGLLLFALVIKAKVL
jgi:hypothetical protein